MIELRGKRLTVPIDGYNPEQMKGAFYQGRVGHIHHAADMPAPRNTPIRAVENGTIGRLFESAAGGLTIYQKDPSGRFVYYYAHLESYAEGLKDGDSIGRGQVIGYVGTSGNAPPNTPHLHFAISVITPGGTVFKGQPVDPYEVFSRDASVISSGPPAEKAETTDHLPPITAQFPPRSSTTNNDRHGVSREENNAIQIKQPTQSNRLPQPAKRQINTPNQNQMPPVAPQFRRASSMSLRTHPAKPPPQPIPVKNKSKSATALSQSKKQKEPPNIHAKSNNSTADHAKTAIRPKQTKKESPKPRVETSSLQKTGVNKQPKSVARGGSAHTVKPALKTSATHHAAPTVKTNKVGRPENSTRPTKGNPTTGRKTVGSEGYKNVVSPTRKLSKSSKSAKPQKPSVVLRKQNKVPTPKKRSVH